MQKHLLNEYKPNMNFQKLLQNTIQRWLVQKQKMKKDCLQNKN